MILLVSFTLGRKMAFIVSAFFSSSRCGRNILVGSVILRLADTRVKSRSIRNIQLHYHRGMNGVEKKISK